jgi:hypothetical protein
LERSHRRWAVRRLIWDRKRRGGAVIAYVKTLAMLLFCPWRAARGLIIPDREHRAGRWAAVHVLVAAFGGVLLAGAPGLVYWSYQRFASNSFRHPAEYDLDPTPADRLAVWMCQSGVAWTTVLVVMVSLGCLLALGMPGHHRAARWGGVKWSLYLTALFSVPMIGWRFVWYAWAIASQGTFMDRLWRMEEIWALQPWLPACVFGVWWAAGMAANPYGRWRGRRAWLGYALVYGAVWFAVARILFPMGSLGDLL